MQAISARVYCQWNKVRQPHLLFLEFLILRSWASGRSCSCTKGKLTSLNQGFSTLAPWTFLLLWGAVLCMVSSIPGLHLLDASSIPQPLPLRIKNVSRYCQMSPGAKIVPSWESLTSTNHFLQSGKKRKKKEGCGRKRSGLPAATRVTYVIGPAMPLSPLHQHYLGDDQGGEEDQDHLHVHGLVAPVHLVHLLLLQAGTGKWGHLQKSSTFAHLAKKIGWAHKKQLGISNVRAFKLWLQSFPKFSWFLPFSQAWGRGSWDEEPKLISISKANSSQPLVFPCVLTSALSFQVKLWGENVRPGKAWVPVLDWPVYRHI